MEVLHSDHPCHKAIWSEFELREVELEFRSECNYGDKVNAICCRQCEPSGDGGVVDDEQLESSTEASGQLRDQDGEKGTAPGEEEEGEVRFRLVHMLLKSGVDEGSKEAEVVRARTTWKPISAGEL